MFWGCQRLVIPGFTSHLSYVSGALGTISDPILSCVSVPGMVKELFTAQLITQGPRSDGYSLDSKVLQRMDGGECTTTSHKYVYASIHRKMNFSFIFIHSLSSSMKASCDLSNRCFAVSLQRLWSMIPTFCIFATGWQKKNEDCINPNALYFNVWVL